MSYRSEYKPPRVSAYFELFIGGIIGLALGGFIPLVTGSHFTFSSWYFYLDCVVISIGFVLCIDGIRRLP